MVMVVDIKVFILSASLKTLRSCGLVVDDRVDGKDNHEDETMEFHDDIMITSVRIIGLLLLLAGALLPLFQLDDGVFFIFIQLYDVMSLGFVSPALIEELLSEGIHHDVSNFHALLHLNVLAIHSVVDHQHTCT